MVLSSQVPREAMSRGYMSSHARSWWRSPMVWAVLVAVLAAGGAVWWALSHGGDDPAVTEAGAGEPGGNGGVPAGITPPPPPDNPQVLGQHGLRLGEDGRGSDGGPPPNGAGDDTPPDAEERDDPGHLDPGPGDEPPLPPVFSSTSTGAAKEKFDKGIALLDDGHLVDGRAVLSDALFNTKGLSVDDARTIRERLIVANQKLVLSREMVEGDPVASRHMVRSGENFTVIGWKYGVTPEFLSKLNGISPRRLQADKPIKVIHGPFHARIHKHLFLMDVFVNTADGKPIYITTYPVGLGKDDKTPVGRWKVANAKVENPDWRNPETGEYYAADDPDNPIGEYWIPLEGTDENTASKEGYGIHGTTEPNSIGRQMSMGCIRLLKDDIATVYDLLVPERRAGTPHSTVQVMP